MADLNDDIKKYLRGELTPAEMHALEKKALNDPFLEEALEGAVQLDAAAFDSDLKNLRSSLEDRVSAKRGKVVSLWVWSARIAAGLALIAISTFIVVKLTDNRAENDLALQQQESPAKDRGDESVADSTTLSSDVASESQSQTPARQTAPAEKPKKAVAEESKPAANAASGPPTETAVEKAQAENEIADEQLAKATDAVPEQQPQAVAATEAEEGAAARKTEKADAVELTEEDKKQRVAAAAPAERASGLKSVNISKVIRGRVESVDGVGLPGVNVMIKNTNIGTVTDEAGNYQLTVTQNDPNLVFSFIGFTSTEIAAGDKAQVNVQLSEDVSQLSEIVVVGYGAEKKSDDAPETLELANPYGGRRAYKQYLEKNMQYPEQALAQNIEGKVTIQFTVESSGQISDFKVLKGIGHGCDEEVIRLVKEGPKWNPTRRNTESLRDKVKVRMKFTLPKK